MNTSYVCHSGGCPGADMIWENEGYKYGVTTISYSFHNHIHEGNNPKMLTVDELKEGWFHVNLADKKLRRNIKSLTSPYIQNLLCRNWFQVKNAEAVFAVGKLLDKDTVAGGTGWAVQMAIDSDKPVYFYDQSSNPMCSSRWMRFMLFQFENIDYVPKLTKNFAGIGTRDLTDDGKNAIINVYKSNFNAPLV